MSEVGTFNGSRYYLFSYLLLLQFSLFVYPAGSQLVIFGGHDGLNRLGDVNVFDTSIVPSIHSNPPPPLFIFLFSRYNDMAARSVHEKITS
jgi:hypothetical protein